METLTIEIPDKKVKIVEEILKKLNVKIIKAEGSNKPNALTIKTIEDARNGIWIEGPIEDISSFINSIN